MDEDTFVDLGDKIGVVVLEKIGNLDASEGLVLFMDSLKFLNLYIKSGLEQILLRDISWGLITYI